MPQSFLRCGVFLRCFSCANFCVLLVSAILNSTFGRLRSPKVHFARGQPLEPDCRFCSEVKNVLKIRNGLLSAESKTALILRRLIFTGVENSLENRNGFSYQRLLSFVAPTVCCCGGDFSAAFTVTPFTCSARFRSIIWSSSLKSLTEFSAKILLHGIKPLLFVNLIPALSLSTQAYKTSPRSESAFRLFGFNPAIETKTEFYILAEFASCLNESKSIALSKTYARFGVPIFTANRLSDVPAATPLKR